MTYAALDANENRFLQHTSMFGIDGYPVRKLTRGWIWDEFCGVRGAPTVYKTKRACVTAIDNYLATLRDRAAGR